MYNVLEELRAQVSLTAADRTIHEQILEKLVALNDAASGRAEQRGLDIETGGITPPTDTTWEGAHAARRGRRHAVPPKKDARASSLKGDRSESASRPPWPKTLPEQVRILREILAAQSAAVTAEILAKSFLRARVDKIEELLQTLVTLGQARQAGKGKYAAG